MKKSWKDVSIKDYYEINEILEDKSYDEMDRDVQLFAILQEMDPEEAYNLPLPVYYQKKLELGWVWNKPKQEDIGDAYVIGDHRYKVLIDPMQMTTAQYIDFKNTVPLAKDHMESMLSIFLIPEGHKYNEGYNIEEVEKEIKEKMPITKAMGLFAFFFAWSNAWMEVLQEYSMKNLKKALKREKDPEKKKLIKSQMDLLTVTYGFHSLTRSQK